jgi:hypothetical protein
MKFQLHAQFLKHLCVMWQKHVQIILPHGNLNLQSWGPSEQELLEALASKNQGSWVTMDVAADETSDESDDSNGDDAELAEEVEALALSDAYHNGFYE